VSAETSRSFVASFYGTGEEGDPDLRVNFGRFVDRVARKWRKGWPVSILIDGSSTGVGKSTLGIHLCRRITDRVAELFKEDGAPLEPNPRRAFALDHFAFRGRDLEPLYGSLPEWTMTQLDEPRDLMASKGARDRELLHIAGALGSVRKNRIGTVLISPRKEMFDSLVTFGLVNWWLFAETRGVARVHRAWTGALYKKSQPRVPYDRTRLDKIGWSSLDRDEFFRSYEALAVQKNREFYNEPNGGRGRRPAPSAPDTQPLTVPERPVTVSPTRPAPAPDWGATRIACDRCGKSVRRDGIGRHRARCSVGRVA